MPSQTQDRLPPGFNQLAWSNLAAQSAEQIALAAIPIVAVLALGAGAGATGLLQTAATLPFLLLSIPAGILTDRMSRRRLMAWSESLRVVSLVAILVLFAFDLVTWPTLAVLGFLGACGTVVYSVATPALVPALVPPAALGAANGRIELARTVAYAGGPALAGALVGWSGAGVAFTLAAILSTGAVLMLAGLNEPPRPVLPRRHPVKDLIEGAQFSFRHHLLVPVFVTQALFNTAFFMMFAVYVPYAVRHLGLSASEVGATMAAYGIGMIVGALLAPRVLRLLPFGAVTALGPVAGLTSSLVMVLTIFVPSGLLAGLAFFLIGVGPILWVISTTTLRQAITPSGSVGQGFSNQQHIGAGLQAGGCRAWCAGRRALRRGDLSLCGRGWVRAAGGRHPDIAGREARPATGNGRVEAERQPFSRFAASSAK